MIFSLWDESIISAIFHVLDEWVQIYEKLLIKFESLIDLYKLLLYLESWKKTYLTFCLFYMRLKSYIFEQLRPWNYYTVIL